MLPEIIALEMALGGGGQITNYDGVSVRYILLGLAIVIGFSKVICGAHMQKKYYASLGLVVSFIIVGVVIGLINGYPNNDILSAASQYTAWLIFPYLITSMDKFTIKKIDTIFIWAGMSMALIYIIYELFCFLDILDPSIFFEMTSGNSEFFYRGNQYFFYKGFVYFAVSMILINAVWKKHHNIANVVLIAATALMSLRGFIASMLLTAFFECYLLNHKRRLFVLMFVSVVGLSASFYFVPGSIEGFADIREASDSFRQDDINKILSNFRIITFLFGEGFGATLNDRLFIENSYMDIYMKTGVTGLVLYLAAIAVLFFEQFKKNSCVVGNQCKAYWSAVIFLLLVSFTNPFINNTIGIYLIMYFAVASNTIARRPKNDFKPTSH